MATNEDSAPVSTRAGARIRELREARGWPLDTMSKMTAVEGRPIPVSTLARIETGASRLDVDQLVTICRVLGIDPSDLLPARHIRQASDGLTLTEELPAERARREFRAEMAGVEQTRALLLAAGMSEAEADRGVVRIIAAALGVDVSIRQSASGTVAVRAGIEASADVTPGEDATRVLDTGEIRSGGRLADKARRERAAAAKADSDG